LPYWLKVGSIKEQISFSAIPPILLVKPNFLYTRFNRLLADQEPKLIASEKRLV